MRVARTANAALWGLVLVLVALVLTTAVLPAAKGWQSVALTGQSMTGTYDMGTLVYIDPKATPELGSVVTLTHQMRLWTHRIIAKTHSDRSFDEMRWVTKGDRADLQPDPFLTAPKDIRGVAVASVPYVGYADLYLKQPMGWVTIGILALVLLFLSKKPAEKTP